MHIAILTLEGFNELDLLIAAGILNRVKKPGWRISIAGAATHVRSMNNCFLKLRHPFKRRVQPIPQRTAFKSVLVGQSLLPAPGPSQQ